MPAATPIIPSFASGEVSPELYGRVDLAKYQSGLETAENFIIKPQGGAVFRPGTRFVAEVKDSTKKVRLVPFRFSTTQAYILEVGDSYTRFHKNRAQITHTGQAISGITKANPAVVTYVGADTYANGDRVVITGVLGMTEVNNREFTVANVNTGANTFELSGVNSSAYTTYTSGGTISEIVELSTPWSESQLADISHAQSADVLYMAHTAKKPRKITRSSHASWSISEINFLGGPMQKGNLDATQPGVYASANTGSGITLTAAAPGIFSSADIGTLFLLEIQDISKVPPWEPQTNGHAVGDYVINAGRIYRCTTVTGNLFTGSVAPVHESGKAWDGWVINGGFNGNAREWEFVSYTFGVVKITAVASATSATADVLVTANGRKLDLPPQVCGGVGNKTWRWARGEWSDTRGWPGAVAFHEQRLVFAGSSSSPHSLWGSKSADYENFTAGDKDDDAIVYTIASNEVNAIKWLRSASPLIIGTVSQEFEATGSERGAPLTPNAIRILPGTSEGSGQCQPVKAGGVILFVNKALRRIHELVYSFETDAFTAPDATLLADHLTGPTKQILGLAWQQEPDRLMWAYRSDGMLLSLTYRPDHEVRAWARHPMWSDSVVESLAVIPSPDGTSDDLWMVVKRTINGQVKRYIEVMTQPHEPTSASDKAGMVFVDSSLEYNGAATTTISGLWHLNGVEVTILADGAAHANKTVSNGRITLDRSASRVQIGLPYTGTLKTLGLELQALGTIQGKKKRIPEVKVRFRNTLGGKVGPTTDTLERIPTLGTSVLGSSPPLFSGIKKVPVMSSFDDEAGGQVVIRQDQPMAMHVLAVLPTLSVPET